MRDESSKQMGHVTRQSAEGSENDTPKGKASTGQDMGKECHLLIRIRNTGYWERSN